MTRTSDKLRGITLAFAALALAATPAAASNGTGGASAPGPGAKVQVKGTGGTSAGTVRAASSSAPVVTGVTCTSACGPSSHTVHIGAIVVLHGHHITTGMTVLFPAAVATAASAHSVNATIHRTRQGLAVTVPHGAHTGKILVMTTARVRSKPYGPIRVLPALPPTSSGTGGAPSGVDVQPTGTAFDGAGMWIWYLSQSDGGNLQSLITQARTEGITTLYVKSSDGASNYWSQFSSSLVQTMHQAGIRVCAWQYVYGTQPAGEAAMGARAVANGADCLVIDAESEYEGNYAAAQIYIKDLRAAVGASYPIGLASFPYVDYHPTEPYSVFLGPGGAQFNVPQVYWYDIGTSPETALAHTYHENRVYGRPIMPLGQTYGGVPPAQVYRFRQLVALYGASGISWWDWQETPSSIWSELAAPLTPLTGVTADDTWPVFGLGGKGDQVLWMQEHLAAAEPQTPTTGVFDSTTRSALVAFQAAHGLPQSAVTDPATWQALLALTPVAVQWTGSNTPAG